MEDSMGEQRADWHKTQMVPLSIYLDLARSYHADTYPAHVEEDYVNCEEGSCAELPLGPHALGLLGLHCMGRFVCFSSELGDLLSKDVRLDLGDLPGLVGHAQLAGVATLGSLRLALGCLDLSLELGVLAGYSFAQRLVVDRGGLISPQP